MISSEDFFWFCALSGSGLFAIQLMLNFFGAMDDDDGNSSGNFKWLSKQAVVGFLMMFGWSGLTCLKELKFNVPSSILVATFAGFGAMFVTALIFKTARKLRSTGTVFRLDDAIGQEATVYNQIPKEGVGKVTLSLQGFTHEVDAISLGEAIPSFTSVIVIKKADDKTLVVVPK